MEIKNEKQYINGVNHAHVLAKHQPKLLKQLLENKTQSDYFIGLQDGQRMYEQNRSNSRLKEISIIQNKKSKDKGFKP